MAKEKKILKFWVNEKGDIILDNTVLGFDETQQTFNLTEITKINTEAKILKIETNDIEIIKRNYKNKNSDELNEKESKLRKI